MKKVTIAVTITDETFFEDTIPSVPDATKSMDLVDIAKLMEKDMKQEAKVIDTVITIEDLKGEE